MLVIIKKIMDIVNEQDGWKERSAKKYLAVLNKERYRFLKMAVESFEIQLTTEENEYLAKELAKLCKTFSDNEFYGNWVGNVIGETPGVVDSKYVADNFIRILMCFEESARYNMIINQRNLSETAMAYLVFNNELNAEEKKQFLQYRMHDEAQLHSISKFPYGKRIIKRIIHLYNSMPYKIDFQGEEREEELKFLRSYL